LIRLSIEWKLLLAEDFEVARLLSLSWVKGAVMVWTKLSATGGEPKLTRRFLRIGALGPVGINDFEVLILTLWADQERGVHARLLLLFKF